MRLPAILHGIALLIALCVQYNLTMLAGMWLFPHLAACSIMLASPPLRYGIGKVAWEAALLWLVVLGMSTFVIQPVTGGASAGWVLAAAPMIAVCMRPQFIKNYLAVSLGIILLYGLGLITQVILQVHYTVFYYPSHFSWRLPAWPLLDPNNAACIMVIGLVPCFYMLLERKIQRWLWMFPVFICSTGLLLTECKAGFLAAGLACLILLYQRLSRAFAINTIALGMLILAAWVPFYWVDMIMSLINSINPRLDIWRGAWPLLGVHPWRGLGMGTFHIYYAATRSEFYSGGFYAHNDFLQLAIEMGFPCVLALLALIITIACTTCHKNLPAACTLLAIGIMSCLEFQLYEWPVSLLAGVALAYHITHSPARRFLR